MRVLHLTLCCVALTGCGSDVDPLDGASNSNSGAPSTTPQTAGGSGSPTGSPTSSPTSDPTGGPTTGETDGTGDGPDSTTGVGGAHEPCERYLDCLAVTAPEALPGAQMGFGEEGTCWQGSSEQIDQCLEACAAGLASSHEAFPDEPKCWQCTVDAECADDERCGDHVCGVPTCGDGVVDADEACDWGSDVYCEQDCSDDSSEGACNPLSGFPCPAGTTCQYLISEPGCLGTPPRSLGDGATCEFVGYDFCGPGLYCAPASTIAGCPGAACCTRLCNLKLEDDCPDGRVCTASLESEDWGVCELH